MARAGYRVHGVDVSSHVVDTINRGEVHIEEVDLDGLVQAVVQDGYLKASLEVEPADIFVIAVPTPFQDLKAVKRIFFIILLVAFKNICQQRLPSWRHM